MLKDTTMWRKEPPTIEEVKCYEFWWNRTSSNGQPKIIGLDIEDERIVIQTFYQGTGNSTFRPSEWGDEWAPCIPPQDKPKHMHHADCDSLCTG